MRLTYSFRIVASFISQIDELCLTHLVELKKKKVIKVNKNELKKNSETHFD